MTDLRKTVAEQIGQLILANIEQSIEIEKLRAELEKLRAQPENPKETAQPRSPT